MLNANCNVVSLVPIRGGFSPGWLSKPGDLFRFKQASIGFLSNLKNTFFANLEKYILLTALKIIHVRDFLADFRFTFLDA